MLIYWFLPMILFLGIITSYEDIKSGKIRNKWVVSALAYSLSINLFFLFYGRIPLEHFLKWLLYLIISFLIGFLIWIIGWWKAGDAKLFFAFAALILPPANQLDSDFYFSSIDILINSFLPISLFLAFSMIFRMDKSRIIFYLKKSFHYKSLFRFIIFLFSLQWIINIFFSFLNIKINPLL